MIIRMTRSRFVRVALLALLSALTAVTAARSTLAAPQAGLDLRKAKYFMDDKAQVWVSVRLVNVGNNPLTVNGVAPAKAGPWTNVGQNVQPGAMVRAALKVPADGAKTLWVDSSAGILRFDLPHQQ